MGEGIGSSATESLKRGLLKRVVLLVFGFLAAALVLGEMPLILRLLSPSPDVLTRTRPIVDTVPVGAYVEPAITLALLALVGFGIYDVIRTFMAYRKSQQDDRQMFP